MSLATATAFRFSVLVPRLFILLLPLAVLVLAVPWPFVEDSGRRVFGLPVWAAYSIGAAAVFAAVVAFLIGRYWDLSAGADDDDDAR